MQYFANKYAAVAVLALLLLVSCGTNNSATQPKTILLVRHAEKIDESKDAALHEDGIKRAQRLRFMLSSLPIDAVYASPFQRTINTVKPIADHNKLSIEAYSPDTLWQFSQMLVVNNKKCILVSGHSNTTPALANYLMKDSLHTEIDKADYTRVYILNFEGRSVVSSFILHY